MDEQFQTFALTLIGEARGEPCHGIIGVGCVIRNRVNASHHNYKDICLAPNQFSCWNQDDPNYHYLISLNLETTTDKYLKQCIWVAQGIFGNDVLDIVYGSKNYVTIARYQIAQSRRAKQDEWIIKMRPTITLGNHIFLKD